MRANVNIVLADDADFAECRSELVDHGLEVRSEIPALGAVVGTIESSRVAGLRLLDGVMAVELESTLSVPPIPEDGDGSSSAPDDGQVHITSTDGS